MSSPVDVLQGGVPQPEQDRMGRLALAFQEALTAAARLRSDRQEVADSGAFRSHVKRLVGQGDQEARRDGYGGEYTKLAAFAVIAFIDESVLASPQPAFADWPRRPLQEEVFGEHMGGEVFFDNLRRLLASADSADLADVLEVYQLCMLLGFQGRYGRTQGGELRSLISTVADKIVRIRGASGELSPSWSLPLDEAVPASRDPWLWRLGIAALALLGLTLVLWMIYRVVLGSGAADLRTLVG